MSQDAPEPWYQLDRGGQPDRGATPPTDPVRQAAQQSPPSSAWQDQAVYPGAPSQPLADGGPQNPDRTLPSPTRAADAAAPTRKSRRRLLIALGLAAALVVVFGGGVAFVAIQHAAPASAAEAFCGELRVRGYAAAYDMLGSVLRAQYTAQRFAQDLAALDAAEGNVTACGQTPTANAYTYDLGGSTARIVLTMRRSQFGSLQGAVDLANENGVWKVTMLDPALVGIDLGALDAVSTFCADLQSADYNAAYALFGPTALGAVTTQAAFTEEAQLHDQVDGPVTECSVVRVARGSSTSAGAVTLGITRGKLAEQKGQVALVAQNGGWRIAQLDTLLLGRDIGPILVVQGFCEDLANSDYASAYSLVSQAYQGATEEQFASGLTLPSPYKWGGCTPDFSTYQVSTQTASYTVAFTVVNTSTGSSASVSTSVSLVVESGAWKIDDLAQS